MSRFSQSLDVFHGRRLPEANCLLAGYAALINAYNLNVPLPDQCSVISTTHKRMIVDLWTIYSPRHQPEDSLRGHLTFALKYEGIDLGVLHALFKCINSQDLCSWINDEPWGKYSRRIWFLYEWLMQHKLDLPDSKATARVDVLNPKQQYPGPSVISKRHGVRNNLPGVRNFCPLIRRSPLLEEFIGLQLNKKANQIVDATRTTFLTRAAAFLELEDSRASFHIEREEPTAERAHRWGKELGQAGHISCSTEELLRLQKVILGDARFIKLGLRDDYGFIGGHNRTTGEPIPVHISARWADLESLISGLLETHQLLLQSDVDPILHATLISFGFVFIHPFFDGNGRLHRYLMQHVIAQRKFMPTSIILPISTVILKNLDDYKTVLDAYSAPRLPCVQWRPSQQGNVEVLNETIDLYRYFDATKQAEYVYRCVKQAITETLPNEITYLERYDRLTLAIKRELNLPDPAIKLMIRFLEQGAGTLSQRACSQEFKELTSQERQACEQLYADIFHKP